MKEKNKKFKCIWCNKEFESVYGKFCPLCCRLQVDKNTVNKVKQDIINQLKKEFKGTKKTIDLFKINIIAEGIARINEEQEKN